MISVYLDPLLVGRLVQFNQFWIDLEIFVRNHKTKGHLLTGYG